MLTLVDSVDRSYIPLSGLSAPLRDDPLYRNIKAMLPMSEAYTAQIYDPVVRRSYGSGWPSAYLTWDPDGGINCVWSGYALELEAPWNSPGIGYVQQPPFTISIWGKSFYAPGPLYSIHLLGFWTGYVIFSHGPDNVVGFRRFASTANDLVTDLYSASPMYQSRWAHIVGTVERDLTMKLYMNGRLEAEGQSATPQTPPDRALLGSSSLTQYYGSFRDLRLWSGALPARDVLDLYTRGYAKNFSLNLRPDQVPVAFTPSVMPGGSQVHQHHHIIGAV